MTSLALGCESTFLNQTAVRGGIRRRGRTARASLGMITSTKPRTQILLTTGRNTDKNVNGSRNPPLDFGTSNSKHEALKTRDQDKTKRDPIDDPNRLDEWISGTISEIVKNIREAPFLAHVYSERGKGSSVRLQREKATEVDWPRISRRWEEENGNQTPEGVILVKQLSYNDEHSHCSDDEEEVQSDDEEKDGCSLWGILIQGRGLDRSACYVLETTRVRSSIGFCTYYCLARAKCFCGKSPETQLRDSWLVKL